LNFRPFYNFNYDALIDGVVSQGIFAGFTVKGTPIKTSETKK